MHRKALKSLKILWLEVWHTELKHHGGQNCTETELIAAQFATVKGQRPFGESKQLDRFYYSSPAVFHKQPIAPHSIALRAFGRNPAELVRSSSPCYACQSNIPHKAHLLSAHTVIPQSHCNRKARWLKEHIPLSWQQTNTQQQSIAKMAIGRTPA